MANERDRNKDDLDQGQDFGGPTGNRPADPAGERMGSRSEENMRGTGDDTEEDEFEEADDLDEEEDEGEGTI